MNEANNEHEDEETPVEVEVIRYPFNITGLRYYDDLFSRDADAYINVSRCRYRTMCGMCDVSIAL